jgi:type II secretory pathway pseudopilin PulG
MRGHTLVELLLVLTLMGVTGASLAPTALRYRDRAAVLAAREAMVGLFAEARLAAMATGEAWVGVRTGPSTASASTAGAALRTVDFSTEFGVALSLGGGGTTVDVRFNSLGLGSMASQTVRFGRGETVAELVVSTYGRVRRQ